MRIPRRQLPREVRRSLPLADGERVLATGRDANGGYLVATNQALHVDGRRLAYEAILRVTWQGETATLDVWEPSLDGGHLAVALGRPAKLPETVRERVQGTIVISRHVPLRGDRGVVVTARRSSADGSVRWTMMFDPGLDARDPAVRSDAESALARVREGAGV